jgi:hypothetical protein
MPEIKGIDLAVSPYGGPKSLKVRRSFRAKPKSASESTMHEIFHAFLLGKPIMTSNDLGDALKLLHPAEADDNEFRTLAAEALFFHRLGLKIEVEVLVRWAFDNLQWVDTTHDRKETMAEISRGVFDLMYDEQVIEVVQSALKMIGEGPGYVAQAA